MAEKKEKQYVSDNAQLMAEWNWEHNEGLDPTTISYGSGRKVWWKCSKGHEWSSVVARRFNGSGCPYCVGQKVWAGFNDLATINPDLAQEWHPTKNAPLTPKEITANSGQKVWWLCNKGHAWQATIDNRMKGSGCPYCTGRCAIRGETDLATTHPEIALEWHPTKNGDLSPYDISAGSSRKAWWKCSKGHEWRAVIYSRLVSSCPVCTGEARTSFPEQVIYFYLQQITTTYNRYMLESRTEIDVFLPELKIGIEYDGVYFHNSAESDLREKRKETTLLQHGITLLRVKERNDLDVADHTDNIIYCRPYPNFSELRNVLTKLIERINQITGQTFYLDIDVNRDRGKIYAQYISSNKEDSLQVKNPDLATQWHPYKNETLTPLMVTPNSGKRVWWLCENGHEWQAIIQSRNRGNGCPHCRGNAGAEKRINNVIASKGSLATLLPEIATEWHPDKNGDLQPTDVSVGSGKKVWWQCSSCGNEWQAVIASRSKGHGCPFCAGLYTVKGKSDLKTSNPALAKEWNYEKNGNMRPEQFAPNSHRKVWWKCNNGHEWQAAIYNRNNGRGCPECVKKRKIYDQD